MKTLLMMLLLSISVCKAQTQQWASVNINYFPHEVFESNNFELEGAYNLGIQGIAEFLRIGMFVKSDNKFDHAIFGFTNRVTALKTGSNLDIAVTTAVGINNNKVNSDGKGDRNNRHYFEYGADFELTLAENLSVHQFLKKQFYNSRGIFYTGVGITIKLK